MLQPGDIFLLTYSGHGSQVSDEIHPDDEDGMNETLVLFDRNMIDDELFTLWVRLRAGVRILFTSESCRSGTVAQIAAVDEGFFHTEPALLDEDGKPRLLKSVSSSAQQRHDALFRAMSNTIRAALPARSQVVVRASVIQLGACQDQKAADGIGNSFFTSKLLGVWANGAFGGDYIQFFNAILSRMPTRQQPNFFRVGALSVAFEDQRSFTI